MAPVERLEVDGLACARGGRTVFERVSFALTAGEALVVTGPNGAGKSTLLAVLAGLIKPARGRVALVGADPEMPPRAHVHLVGHLDAIKAAFTVEENLAFWTAWLADAAVPPGRILAALESVGLEGLEELPAAHLSAGQRRRLSLARLIAAPRPVWLLDEPSAALDRASEDRLAVMIHDHRAMGGIVVAATHQPLPIDRPRRLSLGRAAA